MMIRNNEIILTTSYAPPKKRCAPILKAVPSRRNTLSSFRVRSTTMQEDLRDEDGHHMVDVHPSRRSSLPTMWAVTMWAVAMFHDCFHHPQHLRYVGKGFRLACPSIHTRLRNRTLFVFGNCHVSDSGLMPHSAGNEIEHEIVD